MLKLARRADALARGIGVIQWTFDPLQKRNTYFNLVKLGGISKTYIPNLYGITTSPLHGGLPTDRLLIEWHLESERVQRILTGEPPVPGLGVREVQMPTAGQLRDPEVQASLRVTQNRRILLVEVKTDIGTGWGEVRAGEGPFYNPETTDTAWLILHDFASGLVLDKTFTGAAEVMEVLSPIRGHEMAEAAIENAIWDVQARHQGLPWHRLLGGTQQEIPCGVSLGIHADVPSLLTRVEQELASGYQRIKLKIKPGKDVGFVQAVRSRYPEIALTVDANSAYTLEDVELLKQMDGLNLSYIEQPLEWTEIYQHAALQRQLKTAICLDECIHGLHDAQASVELGACKKLTVRRETWLPKGAARSYTSV